MVTFDQRDVMRSQRSLILFVLVLTVIGLVLNMVEQTVIVDGLIVIQAIALLSRALFITADIQQRSLSQPDD